MFILIVEINQNDITFKVYIIFMNVQLTFSCKYNILLIFHYLWKICLLAYKFFPFKITWGHKLLHI